MGRKAGNRQSGKREPSGRLSRQKEQAAARMDQQLASRFKDMEREERANLAGGIEARQRVHGLTFEAASQPMASTFVGRLYLGKELSRQQYEAAVLYAEDCANYSRAVHSPRQPGAVDLNATKGSSGDYENLAFVQRAKARHRDATKAVQEAQLEMRGSVALFSALYEIVQMDRELYHMIPDVRVALNSLARHYGLIGQRRAA